MAVQDDRRLSRKQEELAAVRPTQKEIILTTRLASTSDVSYHRSVSPSDITIGRPTAEPAWRAPCNPYNESLSPPVPRCLTPALSTEPSHGSAEMMSISSTSTSSFVHEQDYLTSRTRQLPRLATINGQTSAPTSAGPDFPSPYRERRDIASALHSLPSSPSSPESPRGEGLLPPALATLPRQPGLTTSTAPSASYVYGPGHALRSATSIPDYRPGGSVRLPSRYQHAAAPDYRPYRLHDMRSTDPSTLPSDPLSRFDSFDPDGTRASLTSARTANSSFVLNSSGTERSSVVTKGSSIGDTVTVGPEERGGDEGDDVGMSVDEAIGMYERGFHDDVDHDDDETTRSDRAELHLVPPSSAGGGARNGRRSPRDSLLRPTRSMSALRHVTSELERRGAPFRETQQFRDAVNGRPVTRPIPPVPSLLPPACERDRYGFKKESQHISLAQYNTWNVAYSQSLEARQKKWTAQLRKCNLSCTHPAQFPAKSDKMKALVRKGIPPEWRGAAWFWYAGGHAQLAAHVGLYEALVMQAESGKMSKTDQELIERDLHRTFPDNVKFKPDPAAVYSTVSVGGVDGSGSGSEDPAAVLEGHETATIRALRRVLQAFSIHHPKIGYCQSLNFLAGLLLLFLPEEKAFWMLHIITHVYLPGTHEVSLEGANVDLAVLMHSIEKSMPAIWGKISRDVDGVPASPSPPAPDHRYRRGGGGGAPPPAPPSPSPPRLPTISLCTTAWFMSCFIGTLPIETVLRVWDCFFYEGSKVLFRIALTIFKTGEPAIRAVADPVEMFQVVQTIPRRLLDANALMDACAHRRHGFTGLGQATVDERRRRYRALFARDRDSERDSDCDGPRRSSTAPVSVSGGGGGGGGGGGRPLRPPTAGEER
ncbi:MAG: hypothetical protein M1826_007402 [Phylliscum demangeonii]|nr:MAG: hypothetical protein M1826_007402 [Phylliscum demangeonii]